MGAQPNEIERQIERTRYELGYDVDALADRVSPRRVVNRRVSNAKQSARRLKDRVMGSAESAATGVQEGASGSIDVLRHQTQGNPLAAGLITFGVGWLVASVLPASETEKRLASQEPVREIAGSVGEQVKESARHVQEELKQPTQQAVENVKQQATQAANRIKTEASSDASEVVEHARGTSSPGQ